jgi:hypothetical protein
MRKLLLSQLIFVVLVARLAMSVTESVAICPIDVTAATVTDAPTRIPSFIGLAILSAVLETRSLDNFSSVITVFAAILFKEFASLTASFPSIRVHCQPSSRLT